LLAALLDSSVGYTREETAIFVVTLEENKALEPGRVLEIFGGELCNS